MQNPYKIQSPSLISFSGGRTSGYMLHKILEAHNGKLPDDVYVVFANTGKETEETLEFIKECGDRWDIHIYWLEHYFADERPKHRTKEVTFETAARNGEPFERLIDDRKYLPNPVTRFCTSELKIKVMERFMRSKNYDDWDNVLGLRYDEPRRAISAKKADYQKWTNITPLYDAQATIDDVLEFWNNNDFDLKLPAYNGKTLGGNCDLCFLKGQKTLTQLIKEQPHRAEWWMEQEKKVRSTFHKNYDYIHLVDLSKQSDIFDSLDDRGETCFCHD